MGVYRIQNEWGAWSMIEKKEENSIYKALYETQQNIKQPKLTGEAKIITKKGGNYGYKFAPLNEVQKAVQNAMKGTGLSYIQMPSKNERREIGIQTILYHSSGESIDCGSYFVPIDTSLTMSISQAEGSMITYCKRYTLSAIFGISSEDENADVDQNNTAGEQENYLLIKDRLTELASATGKPYKELQDYILTKINKENETKYTDFEFSNFQEAAGIIKILELKQVEKETAKKQAAETKNDDVDWGNA